MCMTEKFWRLLVEKIEHPRLADDPRFKNMSDRDENRGALTEELDKVFQTKDTEIWCSILQTHVPVSPVHDIPRALNNPFVSSIGMMQSMEHRTFGSYQGLSNPIKFNSERLSASCGAGLGADNEAIFGGELNRIDLENLKEQGVI